ncbi:MAG: gamma-glutamyl hercynylcysteine S-oxide synthase, partial [Solirubrobacteraceae bacterium]|nr:gamma-glutamyl hercynylcysteine S-oxide synthase [Solirubrobacteraceae bacterium]
HISWYEADAFARSRGLRLPTEAEWEAAATWDGTARQVSPGTGPGEANLIESGILGTAPAGAFPEGAAPGGALDMIGGVWEWTAGEFGGYPGFVAHPYREYSEVFFGPDHRVLRGGSFASSARVVTPAFRNWDYPQRRQIFAGVRMAADA